MRGRLQLLCACALLLALLAVLGADAPRGPAIDPACDVFAAPAALGGDDDHAGTNVQAPVRSVSRLLAIVPGGSGEDSRGVACLRGGTYDFSASLEATLAKPWTTLRPYDDEAATLIGRLVISVTARHAVVEGLTLNGWRPERTDSPSLMIFGDAATVRDNTITNDGTAICVHVSDYRGDRARDVTIAANEVYGCGAIEHLNHDNGIYIANADGTRILDNVVRDNQDRGIQLWPDADGSLVEGNVVDHNGEGISVGGERRPGPDLSSERNTIRANLIIRSRAAYADPDGAGPIQANTHGWNLEFVRNGAGSGNLVEDNCFFADHPDPYYATNAGINLADSEGAPVSFTLGPNAVISDAPSLAGTSYDTIRSACADAPKACLAPTVNRWNGSRAADDFEGTEGRDHASAGEGDDAVSGAGASDCLQGGGGEDTVTARESSQSDWSSDDLSCGAGRADVAYADITDRVGADCETVLYRDP